MQMTKEKEHCQLKLKDLNERNISLMRQMTHQMKGEQGTENSSIRAVETGNNRST